MGLTKATFAHLMCLHVQEKKVRDVFPTLLALQHPFDAVKELHRVVAEMQSDPITVRFQPLMLESLQKLKKREARHNLTAEPAAIRCGDAVLKKLRLTADRCCMKPTPRCDMIQGMSCWRKTKEFYSLCTTIIGSVAEYRGIKLEMGWVRGFLMHRPLAPHLLCSCCD